MPAMQGQRRFFRRQADGRFRLGIKRLRFGGRTAALADGGDGYGPPDRAKNDGKDIARFDFGGRFFDTCAVAMHLTAGNQFLRLRARFCEPREP